MSRALDALVAEQVMGEPRPPIPSREEYTGFPIFDTGPSSPGGAWYLGTTGYEDGDRLVWHCLPFSTDLNAAWKVVEKLTTLRPDPSHRPYKCRVMASQGASACRITTWSVEGETTVTLQMAATVPEAICLAALKALHIPLPETV